MKIFRFVDCADCAEICGGCDRGMSPGIWEICNLRTLKKSFLPTSRNQRMLLIFTPIFPSLHRILEKFTRVIVKMLRFKMFIFDWQILSECGDLALYGDCCYFVIFRSSKK
jgi:hypothetical protein